MANQKIPLKEIKFKIVLGNNVHSTDGMFLGLSSLGCFQVQV